MAGRTLEDILNEDLGLGGQTQEKNASAQSAPESDEIEKLAMEVGLVDDKTATATANQTQELTKEAGMSLEHLYESQFPGDAAIVGIGTTEKTASIDKEAAEREEAMGELAFDSYASCFDKHITKIAEALVAAPADGTPPQAFASNEVKTDKAIDTTPQVQDQLMGTSPEGTVGKFENKKAPMGELRKQAARQAYLQSLIAE